MRVLLLAALLVVIDPYRFVVTGGGQPTWVGAGTVDWDFSSSARTLTPGLPAGIQANDILFIQVHQSITGAFPTVDNGYTLIASQASSTVCQGSWWWKRATSSESGPNVSLGAGAATNQCGAQIYAYRGCTTSGDPWDSQQTWTDAAVGNPDSATLTPSGSNRLIFCMIAFKDDDAWTSGPPTNWTNRQLQTTSGGTDAQIALNEYDLNPTSGVAVTGVQQFSVASTDHWTSITICLKP